jgi:hypothetical protein
VAVGADLQDASGDGNLAISDGIFVSSTSTAIKVGDLLDLQGVVEESTNVGTNPNNLIVTQLNSVRNLQRDRRDDHRRRRARSAGRSGRQRPFRRVLSGPRRHRFLRIACSSRCCCRACTWRCCGCPNTGRAMPRLPPATRCCARSARAKPKSSAG